MYYALYHKESGYYWNVNYYSNQPMLSKNKDFFKIRYDSYMAQDQKFWDREGAYNKASKIIIPFEEMEVIEWHDCDNFIYVVSTDCQYEIGGTAVVNIIQIPIVKTVEDREGRPTIVYEDEIPTYENKSHLFIRLINGYVNFGWTERTDEGYSMEYYTIEKGVDELNQPAWLIECTTGGRDCDGQIEHYTYLKSKGGLNETHYENFSSLPLTTLEEIEEAKKESKIEYYRSPMKPSNHKKSYNCDHSAEAMGY